LRQVPGGDCGTGGRLAIVFSDAFESLAGSCRGVEGGSLRTERTGDAAGRVSSGFLRGVVGVEGVMGVLGRPGCIEPATDAAELRSEEVEALGPNGRGASLCAASRRAVCRLAVLDAVELLRTRTVEGDPGALLARETALMDPGAGGLAGKGFSSLDVGASMLRLTLGLPLPRVDVACCFAFTT
jgi:hypothetical protein